MSLVIAKATIWEDAGCQCMARVYGNTGVAITQASLTSITCSVYNLATETSIATPTVTISTSVFDTLQTDARWTFDPTGYNFRFEVAASAFASPNVIHIVHFIFDPTSGENYGVGFEVTTKGIFVS